MSRSATLNRTRKASGSISTPITNRIIQRLLSGDGIPDCAEWRTMVKHAREMERLYYAQRAISVALMK